LSLETTCDETSFALAKLDSSVASIEHLNIASQVKVHKRYGGVVPNLCAREHLNNFQPLLTRLLAQTQTQLKHIDCYSVAQGPGLIPALLVGVSIAKTLSYYHQKPLIPINHLQAHLYSNWLNHRDAYQEKVRFPALHLLVSGGHTQLILMKQHLDYQLLGETVDDAAGEAFDKAARLLGLGYPGGPLIQKYSKKGRANAYQLPRPMLNKSSLDFSFSGLKTSFLYLIKKIKQSSPKHRLTPIQISDLAASFEQAVVDSLLGKLEQAIKKHRPKSVLLCGGVAANQKLRNRFQHIGQTLKIKTHLPLLKYCSDNAAMQVPVVFNRLRFESANQFQNTWKTLEPQADLTL
ncbi:MAG: tRNA (adenosine(37)-N6)-threonylcarbamoyltransferase complex transferase subunit TsaD, partial [Candidatus Moranbacteria bacterium]|nr:tRNA (adenosine(37)-N6)-threonylcarbamoyltransferase complex transferase subunit TsaD [Candidatus Moranbacteria bacterium]